MQSPLPDSSALEAGILEDEQPSRVSRVQDNVRNLLRASILGSARGSVVSSPVAHHPTVEDELRSPLQSPLRCQVQVHPQALPSPASTITSPTTASDSAGVLLVPPVSYQRHIQEMAHQSTLFNTRAVAALNHPDLSDPSLALFLQQKTEERQRRAWKRSKNRKLRRGNVRGSASQLLLCVVAGLLLAAVLATYLALATSTGSISPTFHILFVLGILLATIIFAHTLVRICMFGTRMPSSPRVYVVSESRLKRRHRRHQDYGSRQPTPLPTLPESTGDFVPPTPIPVHVVAGDEVRPDSREAAPSAAVTQSEGEWEKDIEALPNPPPAYGRWRGSVRANPDLLHWQPIPSPVDPDTPSLPSPTYEEAMSAEPFMPRHTTRDSPERRRDMRSARPDLVRSQTVEPEMVEGRGIGITES